jgi:hypothetical protein
MKPENEALSALTETEVNEDDLHSIAGLAQQQVAMEDQVALLEAQLKEAKQKLRDLVELRFPEFLMSKGISETVVNGARIKVTPFYSGRIQDGREGEAFAWLEKRQLDAIIKCNVTSTFGKGQIDEAKKARDLLQDAGLPATLKRNIHPMTMKGFIREQVEAGNPPPEELFGTYIGNKTTIKTA